MIKLVNDTILYSKFKKSSSHILLADILSKVLLFKLAYTKKYKEGINFIMTAYMIHLIIKFIDDEVVQSISRV